MSDHEARALFFRALKKLKGLKRTWEHLPSGTRDRIIRNLVGTTMDLETMKAAIAAEITAVMDAI